MVSISRAVCELGEVIFEREFETSDSDGKSGRIKLQVGKPRLDLEPSDNPLERLWTCPHQFIGIGSERVHCIRGVDPLDALLLSLKVADVRLKSDARTYRKKITWLGEADLGLPSSELDDHTSENTPLSNP